MTDTLSCDADYSKLVTTQTVQSVADNILRITRDLPYSDEQFADAVLAVVHQIPYKITGAKYPVETMVDNCGDCGAVSLLAASIMKAGGLDVILIKYEGINPGHINVGVNLRHPPVYHSLLMNPVSFEYNNKTYWAAEATQRRDWKVGDQSEMLANAVPVFISVDKSEETSPGQISSNVGTPLQSSSITINLSAQPSNRTENKRSLIISGSVDPAIPNSNITIYLNGNGSRITYFHTVTDNNGTYAFPWNFTSSGTYNITASWSGNATVAGADSETLVVFIGPESLVQFQSDTYNYIVGKAIANTAVKPFMGVDNFLSIPLGSNISLSYNFIVLPTGHKDSEIPTEKITLPASEHEVRSGNRQTRVLSEPSRTMLVPASIPPGLEPLMLPDDFNQTINSKFCLIIEKGDSNYSLNVKGLNDYNISDIQGDSQNSTSFLNATEDIDENTWYKVTTTISNNEVTTYLQGADGTVIQSLSAPQSVESSKQLVMLIANNVDNAVIFKELKVEAVNAAPQPTESTPTARTPGNVDLTLPVYATMFLLAAIFAAAMTYLKTKRPKHNKI